MPLEMKQATFFLLRSVPIAVFLGLLPVTKVPAQSTGQGEQLFQANCAACHTIGKGKLVGPDLKGVAFRRDPTWVAKWIDHPRQVVRSGDSLAVRLDNQYAGNMVALGLSPDEIAAIMQYLSYAQKTARQAVETLETGKQAGGVTKKEAAAIEGKVVLGRRLFTGERPLANGGPACQACHSYAGLSALGGGTMGPDLTNSYDSLGQGVVSWPASQPPMRAIYANRPLTQEEKAHMLAFLKAGQGRSPQRIWTLLAYAVGGAGLFFGLMAFIWSDRLREVRRPMIERST